MLRNPLYPAFSISFPQSQKKIFLKKNQAIKFVRKNILLLQEFFCLLKSGLCIITPRNDRKKKKSKFKPLEIMYLWK